MSSGPSLLVYGSMASGPCRHLLRQALGREPFEVLESETLLEPIQRPPAQRWMLASEMMSPAELAEVETRADDLLDIYLDVLSSAPVPADLPVHRRFRAAAMGAEARKWIVPHLLHQHLASKILSQGSHQRVVVAPGTGISTKAWAQAALALGMPLQMLPATVRRMSMGRWLRRSLLRWKRKFAPSAQKAPPRGGQQADVWCASARLSATLQNSATPFAWRCLSDVIRQSIPAGALDSLRQSYQQWSAPLIAEWRESARQPFDPRAILADLLSHQAQQVYPQFAWQYQRARKAIKANCPRLMLCDTQEGSAELAWALAAQDCGVPVAAWTYDHVVNPRFSFLPDHLLCDSTRQHQLALRRGVPTQRIHAVASHRRPAAPTQASGSRIGRSIVFADTYFAGTSTVVLPQHSYQHYRLVVETARRMPQLNFQIKFHPLRDRREASRHHCGMDEAELRQRTDHIHSLHPPPNLRLIAPEISMRNLLEDCAVLLNSNSTVALEAFALGIPVVFLQPVAVNRGYAGMNEQQTYLEALDSNSLQHRINELMPAGDFRQAQIERQRRYLEQSYWPGEAQDLGECIAQLVQSSKAA